MDVTIKLSLCFFFFQAEDGIRDLTVTGVQTCALPILIGDHHAEKERHLTALPIVGLMSFLLGVVIAYQGAEQLRRFSAEIFTVNLVEIGRASCRERV